MQARKEPPVTSGASQALSPPHSHQQLTLSCGGECPLSAVTRKVTSLSTRTAAHVERQPITNYQLPNGPVKAGRRWGQRHPQGANLGSNGILKFLSKLKQWLPPAPPKSLASQCMSGQPISTCQQQQTFKVWQPQRAARSKRPNTPSDGSKHNGFQTTNQAVRQCIVLYARSVPRTPRCRSATFTCVPVKAAGCTDDDLAAENSRASSACTFACSTTGAARVLTHSNKFS